ncbi:cyclin-D [Pycnococcus provasolii]
MRAKERQSYERYGINLAGCHVRVRAAFVEWVLDVCEELQLTLSTASTAVLYADRVLGNVKVPSKSLLLVGACCVLVAAKFEEPESKVPTLKKLHETIIDIYSEELMRKMELAILTELKWDLASVTPAHFVDYFLTSNRHGALDNLPRDACTDTARRYAMVFLSLSLQHIEFTVMFLPSVVAAAVVAAMRSKLGASRWTPSLAAATGYEEADISACCERVLAVYSRTFHTSDESEAMDVEPSSASERADAEAVRNGVALLHIDAAASLRHKEREPSAPSPKGPFEAWGSDGRLVGGA